MSQPVPAAFAVCWCTHTQRRHHDNEGVCLAAGCDCTGFETDPSSAPVKLAEAPPPAPIRPAPVATAAPRAAATPEPVRHPTLLERAAQSPQRTTRLLGQKIQTLLDELRATLAAEAEVAVAQEELVRLRAQLADAVERARGPRKKVQPPKQCPHCPFIGGSGSGLSIHVRYKHPEAEASQ